MAAHEDTDPINKYIEDDGRQISYCQISELQMWKGENQHELCGVGFLIGGTDVIVASNTYK